MAKIITTTTNSIEGWEIRNYLQPISTNVVIGANIFSDFTASLTDFFGGRSGSYERRLNEIYEHAIKTLVGKARSIGANAIVGLKIDFGEVSGKGTQMFMISAVGTPVKAVKVGETATAGDLEGFKSYDGELIERKIRAKAIIDVFDDGRFFASRLKHSSIDFIVESSLPEFCDLVLALLSNWSIEPDSLEKQNKLFGFFRNIDKDLAVTSLYKFLESNEIDDDTRVRFVKIALENMLIDYSKLKPLITSPITNTKKFALDLITAGKPSYDASDIADLKEYADIIPNQFPALGATEQVKAMFSSPKDVWICTCGIKNGAKTKYCSRCGCDNYGFKEGDNKPDKVADLIKKRLAVISSL